MAFFLLAPASATPSCTAARSKHAAGSPLLEHPPHYGSRHPRHLTPSPHVDTTFTFTEATSGPSPCAGHTPRPASSLPVAPSPRSPRNLLAHAEGPSRRASSGITHACARSHSHSAPGAAGSRPGSWEPGGSPFVPVPPGSSISHPVGRRDFKGSPAAGAGLLTPCVRAGQTAGALGAGEAGWYIRAGSVPRGSRVGIQMASGLATRQSLTRPCHARATWAGRHLPDPLPTPRPERGPRFVP